MTASNDLRYVVDKLSWMRAEGIWPNGRRYLWTGAFGVVLLETYRSRDEYDREAITHVMVCSSHFPGYLIRTFG